MTAREKALQDAAKAAHEALDSLWAAIGDRLCGEGPLAKGYANRVAGEVRAAQTAIKAALSLPPPPEETGGELAALEKLDAEATPGPWVRRLSAYVTSEHDDRKIADTETYMRTREKQDANADFISAARTALPALLEEVRRARALSAKVSSLLTAMEGVRLPYSGKGWELLLELRAMVKPSTAAREELTP